MPDGIKPVKPLTSPTTVVACILENEPVEVADPLIVPSYSNPLLKLPLILKQVEKNLIQYL